MSCDDCKRCLEEIQTLKNKLDAMNSYYAQAMTKTLLSKEDIMAINEIIKEIKTPEVKAKVIKELKPVTKKRQKKVKLK